MLHSPPYPIKCALLSRNKDYYHMPVVMMSPLGVTISGNLIRHVRQLYDKALEFLSSGNVMRQGINGYTPDAPVAYIVAVVAVEAFVNEALLSGFAKSAYNNSVLWTMP